MRDLWHHRVNHQSQLCHLGVCTSPQSERTAIIQIEYNTHQLRDTSAAAAWRPARTPPRRPWLRPARVQFRGKSSRGFVLSRASLASLPPSSSPQNSCAWSKLSWDLRSPKRPHRLCARTPGLRWLFHTEESRIRPVSPPWTRHVTGGWCHHGWFKFLRCVKVMFDARGARDAPRGKNAASQKKKKGANKSWSPLSLPFLFYFIYYKVNINETRWV